jgi:hypothetical protein
MFKKCWKFGCSLFSGHMRKLNEGDENDSKAPVQRSHAAVQTLNGNGVT